MGKAVNSDIIESLEKKLGEMSGGLSQEESLLLSDIIDEYKARQRFSAAVSPIEAIKFRIKERGLKPKDVCEEFGGFNRVTEVLQLKRKLTLPMIRKLAVKLNLPFEILVKEY